LLAREEGPSVTILKNRVFATSSIACAFAYATVLLIATGAATSAYAFEPIQFDDLDVDGDGVITRQEAEAVPPLAEHFDAFDTAGDGQLNRDEFQRAMEELNDYPADTTAVRERWEVDPRDHDVESDVEAQHTGDDGTSGD
jgi:hypothetical protein